jgi:hypothetical protein
VATVASRPRDLVCFAEICDSSTQIMIRIWLSLSRWLEKLLNEELHNLYSSPNIIRMNKSKRMRCTGHEAQTRGRGTHIGYWRERQKERDH